MHCRFWPGSRPSTPDAIGRSCASLPSAFLCPSQAAGEGPRLRGGSHPCRDIEDAPQQQYSSHAQVLHDLCIQTICANSASWFQFALSLKNMPPRDHRKSIHDVVMSCTVDVDGDVIILIEVKDVAHECVSVTDSSVPLACLTWAVGSGGMTVEWGFSQWCNCPCFFRPSPIDLQPPFHKLDECSTPAAISSHSLDHTVCKGGAACKGTLPADCQSSIFPILDTTA